MLNLPALAQKVAKTALGIAGSIAVAGTYKQVNATGYDAASGQVTPTYRQAVVACYFFGLKQEDRPTNPIRTGDAKCIVKATDIPSTIVPAADDFIVVNTGGGLVLTEGGDYVNTEANEHLQQENSGTWQVVDIMQDPTRAGIWTFHVRRAAQ